MNGDPAALPADHGGSRRSMARALSQDEYRISRRAHACP